jgi:adenylate cyclase
LPYKKQEIEIDIYQGKLESLMTAEIEFTNLLESKKFIVPKWFDKELTGDKKFSNANLAKK